MYRNWWHFLFADPRHTRSVSGNASLQGLASTHSRLEGTIFVSLSQVFLCLHFLCMQSQVGSRSLTLSVLSACTSQKIAQLFLWQTHFNRISHSFLFSSDAICSLASSSPTHLQLRVSPPYRDQLNLCRLRLDGSIRAEAWRCNLTDGIGCWVTERRRTDQWKFFFAILCEFSLWCSTAVSRWHSSALVNEATKLAKKRELAEISLQRSTASLWTF